MRLATVCSALSLTAAALVMSPATPAHACGGCFSPPDVVTSVDSHRMVVALSPDKSILWDQIRYSGSPEDFVWVLPVPSPNVTIGVADDLFFAELEQQTSPTVIPPPLPPPPSCPPPPDNGGFYGQDAGALADAGVDVYQEEVVGPYETAVIGSDSSTALLTWLDDHGYAVPPSLTPIIDSYTATGSLFVVMRLAPEQGVQAMQPVRVEYPGYLASFPLKMVTAGAYGSLDLTLWVIADQRYQTHNYPTVEVNPADLVFDYAAFQSNYRALYRAAIDGPGAGRGWVAQFARPLDHLYLSSPEVGLATAAIRYPFLTRLSTNMLVDHLVEDMVLVPSEGDWLDNVMQAETALNPPPPATCPDYDGDGRPDGFPRPSRWWGCGVAPGAGSGGLLVLMALALVARRRATSRRRS